MSDVEALRGVPVFNGLNDAALRAILGVVHSRHVLRGAVVLREGDPGDSLFILVKGSVEVTKRLGLAVSVPVKNLKDKVLVRLDAPQFFGEMGLLEATERSATVSALSDCDLYEVTKSDFERLIEEDPMLGYLVVRNIATVLSSRLRRADRDVVKLTIALSLALGNR